MLSLRASRPSFRSRGDGRPDGPLISGAILIARLCGGKLGMRSSMAPSTTGALAVRMAATSAASCDDLRSKIKSRPIALGRSVDGSNEFGEKTAIDRGAAFIVEQRLLGDQHYGDVSARGCARRSQAMRWSPTNLSTVSKAFTLSIEYHSQRGNKYREGDGDNAGTERTASFQWRGTIGLCRNAHASPRTCVMVVWLATMERARQLLAITTCISHAISAADQAIVAVPEPAPWRRTHDGLRQRRLPLSAKRWTAQKRRSNSSNADTTNTSTVGSCPTNPADDELRRHRLRVHARGCRTRDTVSVPSSTCLCAAEAPSISNSAFMMMMIGTYSAKCACARIALRR